MTRADVLLKNTTLINEMCEPARTRAQLALVKESLGKVVGELPAFIDAVDAACGADEPTLSPELVAKVLELREYFNEENKPKSTYLFMSKDWKDEVRPSYVTREEAIQSKQELEEFVMVGSTFDHVFDLDKLDALSVELEAGLKLAREVGAGLSEVSERLEATLGTGPVGSGDVRKKMTAVFGRENVAKYFNLRNDISSWATSVSYWVSDMVRVSSMTTRVCDAIRSGLERTVKAEEWLTRFKEEVKCIDDEDVKAYEQKRYMVHG